MQRTLNHTVQVQRHAMKVFFRTSRNGTSAQHRSCPREMSAAHIFFMDDADFARLRRLRAVATLPSVCPQQSAHVRLLMSPFYLFSLRCCYADAGDYFRFRAFGAMIFFVSADAFAMLLILPAHALIATRYTPTPDMLIRCCHEAGESCFR